jgi:nucleoid-associated protein YgaU
MGKLEKLTIQAYKTIDFKESDKVGEPFVTMFNPDKYDENYGIEYKEDQAQGTAGNASKFNKVKPKEYQFDFLIDGTGAAVNKKDNNGVNLEKKDVGDEIKKFLKVVYEYKGDEHRPRFCMIKWGKWLVLRTIFKSCNISYTLFKPNGYPLRARIKATFSEVKSDDRRAREQDDTSPDMTHIRQVQEGDHLVLMSYRIYEDIRYYPLLARFNNLDQFQVLKPGTEIRFPPVDELLQLNSNEEENLSNV